MIKAVVVNANCCQTMISEVLLQDSLEPEAPPGR
jgi:hypothetical protein